VTCRLFSPGTPVSSTNKTDSHDMTEILLKVALNTTSHTKPTYFNSTCTIILSSIIGSIYICLWFIKNALCFGAEGFLLYIVTRLEEKSLLPPRVVSLCGIGQ
jgi:hypothetical protein